MSSTLKVSLPLNVEEDAELTDRFKDSALAITALFKHAQKSRKAAFAQGYNSCVSDLRDYIRSNARTSEADRPLTVGAILDFLENRQVQLLRDLEVSTGGGLNGANTSTSESKPPLSRPTKSPSPSTPHTTHSVSRQRSPTIKSTSPRLSGQTPTPNVPPWVSPSLSPTAIVEPDWSDLSMPSVDSSKTNAGTGWPEVSVLSMLPLPVSPTTAAVLPSAGGKRKRDALVEVDSKNMANVHLHGRHGGNRRRKGNPNRNGNQNRINEDWQMDVMDDEVSGRERKRVRG
ncbi:SubName: Full=Uncharacterized protein {ECO:0000313/EMBL:CCA69909.1} [Serendipita indica DSM 11827]|uniref:Uncharacterized protein n=1 Tax=Serendipita indica (strain DSM 11827) TaxID=1109443 RepID=G4TF16_SERID|nr:SubName: Full=Uncharacterized protein {ECO:0000313/EMBL:CCA69909.1} [Serendipita indica DSM 11827]CCA69909.1 hypothetical protein PIIN_03849 [Serendipita indica DSM 11827]